MLKVQLFVIAAPAKPVRLWIGIASDASGAVTGLFASDGPKVAEVST
jgi:hypothetical protein